MTRLMVTGAGSNVAQGIIAGIRAHDPADWILGTDVADLCAGYFMCDKGAQVPYAVSPDFAGAVTSLIRQNDIDFVLVGVDGELEVYARLRKEIETATGCKLLLSDTEIITTFTDKFYTAEFLRKAGLPYPRTVIGDHWDELSDSLAYPLIAKPRKGNASKGMVVVREEAQLKELLRSIDPSKYCFQEYIEGEEYTCGLLFDKNNRLCDSIIMQRELQNGTTVKASVVESPEIQSLIEAFGGKARAFGSINLQLRLRDGVPLVFEVNPRFSGTTAFRLKAGYNDVGRLLDNVIFDKPIPRSTVKKCTFFRYWETLAICEERLQNVDVERTV